MVVLRYENTTDAITKGLEKLLVDTIRFSLLTDKIENDNTKI
jgi:hypothetical protein